VTLSESKRSQAFVSYAILALVLSAAVFALLAAPVRERAAFFTGLATLRATYAKALEALARSEAVSAQVRLRQADSDPSDQVFRATTPALAGAELQNQLNALISAEGAKLLSSAFRESSNDGPLTPIAVTIRLRCSVDALLRILHGLEGRSPLLLIDNLTVQARQRSTRAPAEANADLDVELDVLGFLELKPQAAP
jgi:general secretion pathway protein M